MNEKVLFIFYIAFAIFECSEVIEPDHNLPTQISIKSMFHYSHNFIIKWEKSTDDDFESYEIYESNDDDMTNEIKVFSSKNINDTTAIIPNIEYYVYKYYRLDVRNVSNNVTGSPIYRGSSFPIVLFESDRDDAKGEIYMIQLNENEVTRLTHNPTYDGWPRFAPDGSKFVFETKRDGNYELYLYDMTDNSVVNLTNSSSRDVDPYFTPDGSKIVFASDRNGYQNVYIMNSDGTSQIQLTNENMNLHWPSVSPTGDKISVTSSGTLFWMNIDGSNLTRLLLPTFLEIPRFSPDGSQIAVTSNELEIWEVLLNIVDLQGGHKWYDSYHSPIYHPIENYIYVGVYPGTGIYKMDVFSEEFIKISDLEGVVTSISSEGIYLLCNVLENDNYEIYSMNSDGSNPTNLTNNNARDWGPQIQPLP
jgi:Tol biopolymer transport system component